MGSNVILCIVCFLYIAKKAALCFIKKKLDYFLWCIRYSLKTRLPFTLNIANFNEKY